MTEVLIEENFVHIDGTDMNVILDLLDRLGLEAEPTAPRHISERRHWSLSLHWLTEGQLPDRVAAVLPGVLVEVRRHFADTGKVPPDRIALYGLDGSPLGTVEPEVAA
ncbi:hypothetical protein GXW83_25845 [Streptacidiphilus sp. PB12-B1b]|uniref:hypothetical protein n=1 Tax=Streptacidiphilus sp. PB12-B1b TaxID=2705012 RepID=UPI0015F7B284|nr:hypothetical protein [Streptacidiphilus sp. PB12-B1b]QMU78618.1 hypothetical protein GXW83_25845 [Streptacidiphilus sp. PB12-B1b]